MDPQSLIVSISTFIGGVIATKLIESFFEKKKKAEEKIEENESSKMNELEITVRDMQISFAKLSGQLELLIPQMQAIGKIREDIQGFYNWKRGMQNESKN